MFFFIRSKWSNLKSILGLQLSSTQDEEFLPISSSGLPTYLRHRSHLQYIPAFTHLYFISVSILHSLPSIPPKSFSSPHTPHDLSPLSLSNFTPDRNTTKSPNLQGLKIIPSFRLLILLAFISSASSLF